MFIALAGGAPVSAQQISQDGQQEMAVQGMDCLTPLSRLAALSPCTTTGALLPQIDSPSQRPVLELPSMTENPLASDFTPSEEDASPGLIPKDPLPAGDSLSGLLQKAASTTSDSDRPSLSPDPIFESAGKVSHCFCCQETVWTCQIGLLSLSVRPSVCLSVRLSVCLFLRAFV